MAASKVFMSFGNITVTPSGGSLIAITEVVRMAVSSTDELMPWQADGHRYPTLVALPSSSRSASIDGGDVAKFVAVPKGVSCVVVAQLLDAKNNSGTGSGTLTFTWTNAVFGDASASGETNKFAGATTGFMCYSPDGVTDPLTVTQVA